jgi:hypothetical protein
VIKCVIRTVFDVFDRAPDSCLSATTAARGKIKVKSVAPSRSKA